MMKTSIIIAALLMSTLSFSQVVQPSAPDTLILKSGQLAEAEIVDREGGDLKYYLLGKEDELRRSPIRMFKEIIEHSFSEQKFARSDEGKILYSEVVPVEGLTASNIFTLSKEYLADTYGNLDKVIELEDKELGMILVEGLFTIWIEHLGTAFEYKVWHSLKLEMKDNRYRYQLYNFEVQFGLEDRVAAESMFSDEENLNKAQIKVKDKILKSIHLFGNDIKKNIVARSKDDKW
ncbi:DUF4468 domain-containing protein [Flavilitoribacter nigricans]|uniref:DUF4468 domain-containing protein n=1 Tax=Flavilitoribacter nigricans (strain ATCC 23147 / DSM 23189 / NBRC 102662 / NCIMB 1420 / SS-2) TaxID=1122177 RepID=A0A2D0NEM2_FLAN2|nr:DUF4468 domain-containing protein [Flavilitoribacter nigricans]PHN06830.1 hypothetical protein CRP01_11135 [Flavilitoribacter nigricans DSM 23189 = NBRC 102662]